jgi:hypothetical protein
MSRLNGNKSYARVELEEPEISMCKYFPQEPKSKQKED